MKVKILYAEDEINLSRIVKESLEKKGFDILWETDGGKVYARIEEFKPDICVLDIMMPNVDGYSLCEKIRDTYPALPVIFLTAKTETKDLLKGFEAGGTDYIRKPFSVEELIVRVYNQLHLHNGKNDSNKQVAEEIQLGKYTYFPLRYELHGPEGIIRLSQREKEVISVFASHKNQVIDRKKLLMDVWGDDSFFNSRNLDVYIKKLRNLLKEDASLQIQTLKGKGYLFLTEV